MENRNTKGLEARLKPQKGREEKEEQKEKRKDELR